MNQTPSHISLEGVAHLYRLPVSPTIHDILSFPDATLRAYASRQSEGRGNWKAFHPFACTTISGPRLFTKYIRTLGRAPPPTGGIAQPARDPNVHEYFANPNNDNRPSANQGFSRSWI